MKPISRQPHLTDLDTAINYNEIFEQLQLLRLAIYAPSAFILPSQLYKYKEEESTTGHRLSIEEKSEEWLILEMVQEKRTWVSGKVLG